ncbi:MAG TPA: family 10 glycosylhydrolase [Vicinamibacteria bacterium]|nr:family 10 glycosylhydrolase [Vicinamibacteria bacterium]
MIVLLTLLSLAGPTLPTVAAPPSVAARPEMRGLWVVRTGLVTPEAVDQVVDSAARAGFNALFVQVRGRGDAFYASRLVARSELLRGQRADFDPLARLLRAARARGMEVHAWINVLLTAHYGLPLAPGHVAVRHPEWLMVPKGAARAALGAPRSEIVPLIESHRGSGDAEGLYLSPSAPGVAAHLAEVAAELVGAYAVDGLHLDFIRYPGPEYDWSRAALEGFRRWSSGGGDLLAAPSRDPEGWGTYRRAALDALAARVSGAARRARPGIVVSAAVVPDQAQALYHKYQSWPSWMARGVVDAVCPMAYSPDTRVFRAQVEQARTKLGPQARLWAGVGAWRLPVDDVIEKIRTAREAGASGVVLFSHESLAAGDLERLRQDAFPAGVSLPTATGAGRGARR